jgi:hypothetical protein
MPALSSSSSSPSRVSLLFVGLAVIGACERPPPGDVDAVDDVVVTGSPVDLAAFVADRPVIGPDWYDYDPATHVLTPAPLTGVWRIPAGDVDDDDVFVAVQPRSYYDEDTGVSGVFTLAVRRHEGDGWGPPTTLPTGRNVKEGPVCVDLVDVAVVDCPGGQLRLETSPRLIPEAGLVVAEPALTVPALAGLRGDLSPAVARVDDAIDDLAVDPASLDYRAHVPEEGMAWGCADDDTAAVADRSAVRFFVLSRQQLGKAIRLEDDDGGGGARWEVATAPLDLATRSIGDFGAPTTVTVPAPTEDAAVVVDFATATITTVSPTTLTGPREAGSFTALRYRADDGRVCTLLSPAVGTTTTTATFASATPPAP